MDKFPKLGSFKHQPHTPLHVNPINRRSFTAMPLSWSECTEYDDETHDRHYKVLYGTRIWGGTTPVAWRVMRELSNNEMADAGLTNSTTDYEDTLFVCLEAANSSDGSKWIRITGDFVTESEAIDLVEEYVDIAERMDAQHYNMTQSIKSHYYRTVQRTDLQ